MYESPRLRRLRNDLKALEELQAESSVFHFTADGVPPAQYRLLFLGRGLWRDRGQVRPLDKHHVEIKLGPSYPRALPEIRWLTPIFHPNISEIGMVCLGGYGTHWAPSVQLDELCLMLWDMLRYQNYDIRSPYNRDAAFWVASQTAFSFPTDPRTLRDRRVALGRVAATDPSTPSAAPAREEHVPAHPSPEGFDGRSESARSFVDRHARAFGVGPAAGRNRDAPEDEIAPRSLATFPRSDELARMVGAMSFLEADGPDDSKNFRGVLGETPDARGSALERPDAPTSGPPGPERRPSRAPASDSDIVFIE